MCGIAGIADPPARPPTVADAAVQQMVAAMTHRGPDHGAVSAATGGGMRVTLGYRRLSILDLTPAGNQPMVNEAGDIRLVYNGELYNHPELRAELEADGHRFRSRSDTETVVHAYEAWGTESFSRFNGMFALAIHDLRRDVLVLARDRRGIKPLYYRTDGSNLVFASELKALITAGAVDVAVEPTALWLYLCLGFVPSPHCIVEGVRKLEPGHFLESKGGSIRIADFRGPPAPSPDSLDHGEAVIRVREEVERAVERQLMSDVPVGVFLSGGLDSSIVAALAARHGGDRIHTFSAGYADAQGVAVGDSHYNDDFFAARKVAEILGTQHHEVVIQNRDSLTDQFELLIPQLDEPMVEPVFVTTHHLSRLARESGVPVVLTGDGADELFGGYDRYFSARRLATYRKVPGLAHLLPFIASAPGTGELGRSAREVSYLLDHRSDLDSYLRFTTIYRPDQALALLAPHLRPEVDQGALADVIRTSLGPVQPFVDQMAYLDLVLWVGEHFNPRLDRISMLDSVEARVPFQDNAVVDLALSIPSARKSARSARKQLLAEAFASVVPPPARIRPKRSFQAPNQAWLQGGLEAAFRQLSQPTNGADGLFDARQVQKYTSTWGSNTPGSVFAVSALVIANVWARHYQNGR